MGLVISMSVSFLKLEHSCVLVVLQLCNRQSKRKSVCGAGVVEDKVLINVMRL